MMGNPNSILLVILCTVFTSIGQIFFKLISKTFTLDISKLIANSGLLYLILGAAFYLTGAILLILALRKGKLSTIYPFIALSFIWVFMLSIILFQEKITAIKIAGTLAIIAGVAFIARSK